MRVIKAPFVNREKTAASMMGDALIALLALLVLPVLYRGPRPAIMAGLTALTCFVCELLFELARTKTFAVKEASSLVTGLTIAVLMPSSAPYWLPMAAGAFAILVAKGPFGATGRNPFNPAAAGFAFAAVCWPDKVFSYLSAQTLPLTGSVTGVAALSPSSVLKQGLKPDIVPLQMLWGKFVGPMGTTAILVIAACALFLCLRRASKWEITVCFMLTAAVIAALFPRIACSPLTSIKYELMSGSLFFCGVFMVTDPVTSPRTTLGRCLFGAMAGGLVMAFRNFGVYEQGACFAVLISNAAAPLLDRCVCDFKRWRGGAVIEK